jgi:phenylpropionate dioxygenase-like ring-hydroxylating dioxygenase large terminal subunit
MFPQFVLPEHIYPSLRYATERNLTWFVRDLPYSFDFLVENFMDPAHIPFAHNSLQSLRSDGGEIPMEVLVSNFTHLEISFKDQVRGKKRE